MTIDGDLVTHHSRRLLEATPTLLRAGVPLGEVLDAGEFVQTQAAAVADRFVAPFRAHAIGAEGLEQLSATRLRHITEAVAAPRPPAGEAVAIEFARDSGRGRLRPRAGGKPVAPRRPAG
ncbi:hypothetical protein [Streptomyces sp. H34-S4]|uniref:hypothetical protein n=1 Tax=Streptomyces sp. H34-S4 TaxID=2996463 RepID=UPI002270CC59|nr:hypothetical protein [Streptomyces sp. H34-S4]MCY0937509.1 hypothetical protein [Streptomyces sp. H34-S4]